MVVPAFGCALAFGAGAAFGVGGAAGARAAGAAAGDCASGFAAGKGDGAATAGAATGGGAAGGVTCAGGGVAGGGGSGGGTADGGAAGGDTSTGGFAAVVAADGAPSLDVPPLVAAQMPTPANAAPAIPSAIHSGFFDRRPKGESSRSIDRSGARAGATASMGGGRTEGTFAVGAIPAGGRTEGAFVGTSIGTGTGRTEGGTPTAADGGGVPAWTITSSVGSFSTVGFGGACDSRAPLPERAATVARTSA